MIPLALECRTDAQVPFVTKLCGSVASGAHLARLIENGAGTSTWSGEGGLFEIPHGDECLSGDVVLIDPFAQLVERLIRSGSDHNTLLVTEQCDQLCVMCSQPPKKTHTDRFDHFTDACMLADQGTTIGISGGEPTLHMEKLLTMLDTVLRQRSDLRFHVLTNGQHFERQHVEHLRAPHFRNVGWGIPLYAADGTCHDVIVGKPGAYERLLDTFHLLLAAGARIELRTVLLSSNAGLLDDLASFIASHLPQIEQWSLMDLENAGFARTRFAELRMPVAEQFALISSAIDRAVLHGVPVRLFNMPLCHLPAAYRHLAVASISDWKRRFADACDHCAAKPSCSGFFEWHPDELVERVTPL